ncbi:sugar ABC transporter substrate-binding protein [Paenibacillus sp. GCM10027628]|uniref:sugar ABC transporter substrate-binding protein n=1 Tax=Paenibacillus sp. GCM10027628 TaxID=3273413 RepID=UPI003627697A
MKKMISVALTVLLGLSLAACSMQPTTSPANSSAPTKTPTKKIGFLVPTLQGEFFINLVKDVTDKLKEKGYTVEATSFDSDSSKEISAIENYTVAGVDEIIVMLQDDAASEAMKAAMDKGIKIFAVGKETKYYDFLEIADNTAVGNNIAEMAADYVKQKYNGKTQIGVMTNTKNTDLTLRSSGIVDTLQKLLPDSTIVMKQEAINIGEGTAFTENLLQKYPDTKVVVAYGDAMALEAVEVFKAAGKTGDGFAAFGADATKQGLQKIADGDIFRGTIDWGNFPTMTADNAYRLVSGDNSMGKKVVVPGIKVTKENISKYVK